MPILGDNTISKSTQLHRTFEGRTDWASQTELNNREAQIDAMREHEAEKAERTRKVLGIIRATIGECYCRKPLDWIQSDSRIDTFPVNARAFVLADLEIAFEIKFEPSALLLCETASDLIDLVEEKLSAGQQ